MYGQHDVNTPEEYIAALEEPRRSQIAELHALIREVAPELEPHIQSKMLSYGRYTYRYANGKTGDWMKIALASNKAYISLYICASDEKGYIAEGFKTQLPKASIGKACVRFKRLEDLDRQALRDLIAAGAAHDFSLASC